MGLPEQIASKQKTASGTAEGSGMEKNTPRIGDQTLKNNQFDPVTRNQGFTLKTLGQKRVTTGY